VKSPAELTELFRAQGLKVTPQRQCIFRALHDNPEHPTAEAVYASVSAEMPTISLRTVYQTLNDLASMGELVQLELGTGSARFDPNLDAHHHLVCHRCGKVLDVDVDASSVRVPSAGRRGFNIESTEIVFRGVCADCADLVPSSRSTTPSSTHQAQKATMRSQHA
jgi:Fe2+ or Zn2+ uptake regulation protein